MNTHTVCIKKTHQRNMNLSCISSLYSGFPLPCFIKIGYDISASIVCLSHLFIGHSSLEIPSIKVLRFILLIEQTKFLLNSTCRQ